MFLGGNKPSYEDKENIDEIGNAAPDAEVYPHTFAWYSIVSKFTPEARAKWEGLKALKPNDWKDALGKYYHINF